MAKSNETLKRILIALIFIPALVFSIFSDKLDMGIMYLVLFSAASFFGSSEVLSLVDRDDIRVNAVVSAIINISLQIMAYLSAKFNMFSFSHVFVMVIMSGMMFMFLKNVFTSNTNKTVESVSINTFSLLYPGLFLSLLILMKYEYGPWYVLYLLAIAWGGDAGAYFVGHKFGRTKMNLKASPNKTLEGYIGGVILAIIMSLVISRVLAPMFTENTFSGILFDNIFVEIIMIVLLSFIGFCGDLLESSFKRSAGKKDSCKKIRLSSHGGILDVLDSVTLTSAAAYLLFQLVALFH